MPVFSSELQEPWQLEIAQLYKQLALDIAKVYANIPKDQS